MDAFNPSYVSDTGDAGYTYNGVSQDPSMAVGGGQYTTPQSAMDAWFAANPQYAQFNTPGALGANMGTAAGEAATQQQQQTQALLQPTFLGAPTTYQAATATAPTANAAQFDLGSLYGNWGGPSTLGQGMMQSLGAGNTIQELLQGLQPQAQSANNNLTQMLANFGVGGGQAVGAESQLQSQLMASIAPSIANAIQNSQANQLQGSEFNANARNTNQNALNSDLFSALGLNTQNQQSTNNLNANNALTVALQNAQLATGANAANANAYNSTNAYNVGAANTANQQALADMLAQYQMQFNAANGINSQSQGAGNQQALNFGQDITVQPNPFVQGISALTGAATAAVPFFPSSPRNPGTSVGV